MSTNTQDVPLTTAIDPDNVPQQVQTVRRRKKKQICKFCKQGGQAKLVFEGHRLYDAARNVLCPRLLNHECGICKVYEHTESHCTEKMCIFCVNAGKPLEVFTSHRIRDQNKKLTYPSLASIVCPKCGATGEDDHTNKNCTIQFCTYCKRGRQSEQTYTSHTLRDKHGNLTCPRLLQYVCTSCNNMEGEPHTERHCKQMVCGFCRNSGASPKQYTSHRLRNEKGVVECHMLRRVVCLK